MGQAGAKAPRVLPRVGFKLKDGREIIPPNDIALDSDMFCMQCEETLGGAGCESIGVCGKTADVAALQDLLMYQMKGIGAYADLLRRKAGHFDAGLARFTKECVFATLTNTNFDSMNLMDKIMLSDKYLDKLRSLSKDLETKLGTPGALTPEIPAMEWFDTAPHPAQLRVRETLGAHPTLESLMDLGFRVSLAHRRQEMSKMGLDTLLGLHELIVYGLKGVAAYGHHAEVLGYTSETVDGFMWEALGFLTREESRDVNAVLTMALRLGEVNLETMRLLDQANTETYGTPTPTPVRITPKKGKALLVSGHDLRDLEQILQQTEGTGINVYTHGEMLPGHGYPELKKYPHLVGNYGGAWYRQKAEFDRFPGSIVMTTNCVLIPNEYGKNLFTTGNMLAVPGVKHITSRADGTKDFGPAIKRALELPGFEEDAEDRSVLVGFGHASVLSVADQVLHAVEQGNLKHIFLVGGCDGRHPERKYYTQVVDSMPQETLVLTLGCGKFRFFDHDLGKLPGSDIPRLLDMGQCNDAYSAIVVASALADALKTDINSLPLSLDISWFEQKAVAVLLTLLHLGVKNIRLGPTLPAFLTPEALQIISEKWGVQLPDLKDPEADVAKMMGQAA